ncbi:MAG: NusG domain II-containing protein [Eubacteriales bacterium]
MKNGDWILGLCLVLLTLGLSFVIYTPPGDSPHVVVTQAGHVVATVDATMDQTVEVGGNTIQIQDGTATMVSADCPNQVCVHQGTITQGGQVIVCAPNQITVTIETADSLDSVAY